MKSFMMDSLRMEWNAKTPAQWDWENLALFNGKTNEVSKQVQPSEWGIDNGSIYSSGGWGCSGSDVGNESSSKSSISASFDSTPKVEARVSVINFEAVEGFPRDLSKKKELARVEDTGSSPKLAASVGSGEPLIGLKLGKRTYFEDVCAGGNMKVTSLPETPAPSTNLVKKFRLSHQSMHSPRCQVEGCNVDLTSAKDYHRKHRVCESHSKCPKVIVAGQERRFCQQCSRFHDLSEFDQKKRSCRRRLSDHNARRRKPPPDTISFNSARLSSSFFDDRQQMNLLLSRAPFGHMRPTASSTWDSPCDFKLTQGKGSWIRSTKAGGIGGQLDLPGNGLSTAVSTLHHDMNRLLPYKGTTPEVLNQGLEASVIASNLDGAPDLRRALSLLSTDSWGSTDPGPTSLDQLVRGNHSSAAQPTINVAHPSSDYWQAEQPLAHETRALPFTLHSNGSQFQEFQLLKSPYDTTFFDSNQIH